MAEATRAGGSVSSDILSHSLLAEAALPEARHFSVTRYATQERAGTVHLQAVSVPEVRHYPRLFRNKKVPQAMLTELLRFKMDLNQRPPD